MSRNCSYFISSLMFKVLWCIWVFSRAVEYNVDLIASLTKVWNNVSQHEKFGIVTIGEMASKWICVGKEHSFQYATL